MASEFVMTLVNTCECTESGECLCTEIFAGRASVNTEGGIVYRCECECECINCETEYVAKEPYWS